MDFRSAPGRRVEWLDARIQSGFSNFLYIDRQFRSHPVLRRLFSLARKHDYQSILVEEIAESECALFAEENEAIAKRSPDFSGSKVQRLSFWRCPPGEPTSADDFIGYAVFKSDTFGHSSRPEDHIFESVLPAVRAKKQNNFVHCARTYAVSTEAGPQSVTGVLYAQQNDLTFVCAHVALRTALSAILPDGDVTYATLNRLAGIDHTTRRVGRKEGGLDPNDMEAIARGLGLACTKIVHEPLQGLHLPYEFQPDLYGMIESGSPALLGFELHDPTAPPDQVPRHIVPVIGHTFNDDAWVPDAQRHYFGNGLRYFSSESWLSSYVLHDDNFGPYYCLPRHFLTKDNFRIILGMSHRGASYSASDAETVGFNYLNAIAGLYQLDGQPWLDRFLIYTRQGLLILRTLLLDRADYVRHLGSLRDWEAHSIEPTAIAKIEAALPDRLWVVEASAPELFPSSRRKFGEVLLSAHLPLPKPLDFSLLLGARLPGSFLLTAGGSLETIPVSLTGHSPLFDSDSGEAN